MVADVGCRPALPPAGGWSVTQRISSMRPSGRGAAPAMLTLTRSGRPASTRSGWLMPEASFPLEAAAEQHLSGRQAHLQPAGLGTA
jgi:hypothetical protein